jgi:acetate kinase
MDGLDALVFTGGVGERSSSVRERACEHLSHLVSHLTRGATRTPFPNRTST